MAQANDGAIGTPIRPIARVEWIDIARGIGIILVIYAHALRGLIAAHAYPASTASTLQDSVIYSFHMPLFFFLSGLFAVRARTGKRAAFFTSRLRLIVYPYFLWSILQGVLSILMSKVVNHPTEWADLLRILWSPIDQFWFLYTLLLCQLTLLLPGRYTLAVLTLAMVGIYVEYGNADIVIRSGKFLVFFTAGAYLTARRASTLLARQWRSLAIGVTMAVLFALVYWTGYSDAIALPPILQYYLLGFLGIIATICISAMIGRGGGVLAALGGASMPIYLMHVIVVAGFRTLVTKAHVPLAPVPLLLIATAMGLIVPYLLFLAARRFGLTEVLGFGRITQTAADRNRDER
jgi:fucose 4-O-acetylase-like acetyltransferase